MKNQYGFIISVLLYKGGVYVIYMEHDIIYMERGEGQVMVTKLLQSGIGLKRAIFVLHNFSTANKLHNII